MYDVWWITEAKLDASTWVFGPKAYALPQGKEIPARAGRLQTQPCYQAGNLRLAQLSCCRLLTSLATLSQAVITAHVAFQHCTCSDERLPVVSIMLSQAKLHGQGGKYTQLCSSYSC